MVDQTPSERTDSRPLTARTLHLCVAVAATLVTSPVTAQDGPFTSTAHQLLVADHDMADPRFAETVIYMVWHAAGQGALGVIVNRPIAEVPRATLQDALGDDTGPLAGSVIGHYGGPVEPGRVFALGPAPTAAPVAAPVVAPVVAMTPDEILTALHDTAPGGDPDADTPPHIFAFGYAGWAPGQLAGELARGDWLVIDYDTDLVFDTPPDQTWQRAVDRRKLDL